MSNKANAIKRIQKDLEKIAKEDDPGLIVNPDQKNIYNMTAYLAGPEGTIWQGGIFELSFTFNDEYPNKCPNVVFRSKMFHPNIYHDGRICLDILTTQWSPSYDIMSILISIRSLLNHPNPNSPAHKQASEIYSKNFIQYERKVRQIVALSQAQDDMEQQ